MSQVVTFEGYKPPARYDDVPWTEAKIEEAASDSGPWTLIDTITLSPTDSDPSTPASRNFTTENGTGSGLWYRITFIDGGTGVSNPTEPVRNSDDGPPAQFATADDFADRIGETLSSDERARADALLARVSKEIQDVAGQKIILVTDDVLTRKGTTDRRILLPERPVQSVASVTLNGAELEEGSDWFLDGDEIVRRMLTTFIDAAELDVTTFGRGFGFEWLPLVITYTHGWDAGDIPGFLKEICCEAAGRAFFNPASVARETIGDTATVYDNMRFSPTGIRLTSDERLEIRRFFGSLAGSVPLKD